MRLDGSVLFEVDREKLWNFLIDPQLVSQCAPGVKSVEVLVPDKQFKVVAGVGFGSVNVVFDTVVEILEQDPPNHTRMRAKGKAPGSAVDITGDMYLSDAGNGATELKWNADVTIAGTIASLASRLMGAVTKKLSSAFFECVKGKLET